MQDFPRIIRFLSTNTAKNLYIKDLLSKLSLEGTLSDNDLQNYVLFTHWALGTALLQTKEYVKANDTFYLICKLYNRWKINNEAAARMPEGQASVEFGVDDYIRAKASYAECLMNLGEVDHAIDKFENVKKSILKEIVYDNPLVYVNVCNLLGNCYLAKNYSRPALENFEQSITMIAKLQEDKDCVDQLNAEVSPLVAAKICLNIALIRAELGDLIESVFMHEKSLNYKLQQMPKISEEVRD